jgi:hypothetical protein
MTRCVLHFIVEFLWFCILPGSAVGQLPQPLPKLNYDVITDFFQLLPGEHFVEPAGVAVFQRRHLRFPPRETRAYGIRSFWQIPP